MTAENADPTAKSALLEAAQRLFAQHGFDKVSLRMLTQEAQVNLAAVNYHFRSKQGLIDAVIESYINPVNERRLRELEMAESEATGDSVSVDKILDCFLRPVLETVRETPLSQQLFFKLMGRCMNDGGLAQLPKSTLKLFGQVTKRFPAAIHRALPHVSEQEILWRLHFTIGVLTHVLAHHQTLQEITQGRAGQPSPDEVLSIVKQYCGAGITAEGVFSDASASRNVRTEGM